MPTNTRSQSKSRDTGTCNYCKNPGHIKVKWQAVKAKNEKAQILEQKGSQTGEVNFVRVTSIVDSLVEILSDDPNILIIKNMVKSEVLYMIKEATSWLLDSGASNHVTPNRSKFRQYTTCNFDSV